MESAEIETVDVLVIGAGLSGLAFASFYLEIHPETNLLIVDESPDIGGVWSNSRMFESFWTQSSVGLSGFSRPPFEVQKGVTNNYNLYHASLMTDYLEEFVSFHRHGGRSLRDRIRLNSRVSLIEKYSDPKRITSWRITCSSVDKNTEKAPNFTITASKLAVASGRASNPYIPRFPGQDDFMGRIIHHKEYGEFCRLQKDDKDIDGKAPRRKVVVLGAGKSAADLVYDSMKNGGDRNEVSWLIRKEAGEGPAIFLPAADPHYDNSLTRSMIRWRNLFSPSSFMSAWHYPLIRLIYGTSYGRAHVEERLEKVRAGCVGLGRYRDREGALPGFKLLEPDRSHYPFWCTGPLGLTQHDDFWDLVAQKVHIYRNDIQSIVKDGIILDDGRKIDSDIILCGTGWRSDYNFLSSDLQSDIDLPGVQNPPTEREHRESGESNSTSSTKVGDKDSHEVWSKLLSDADSKVITQFPVLAKPPVGFRKPANVTISQLFNCMAPLSDMYGEGPGEGRSIVFLGHCDTSSSFRVAEAQGIWATAFLDGNLQLPKKDAAREEIAYMNAFSRRRYPSRGNKGDNIFFEALWYTDKLMADLGLTSHRSHRSWWANWTEPVQMSDFKDMPDEFRKRFGIQAKQ